MIPTLIFTIGFMGLIIAAMTIVTKVSGRRLKGSCGGLGQGTDDLADCLCDAAGTPFCPQTREAGSTKS